MRAIETEIPSVMIFEPDVFGDSRGYFCETWNEQRYKECGLSGFVQDNISFSQRGVLRGLHFQNPNSQGKLVQVLQGEVFDVAVDIRVGSPTFGKHVSVVLSQENHRQFFVPQGFAHGFCVMSETALFAYKCSDYYSPKSEGGILWSDPDLNIDWPISNPSLSGKDVLYTKLRDIPQNKLPVYKDENGKN